MTKPLGSGWWNRHDVYGWKNTGQHMPRKKKRKKQESPLKGIFPAWKAMDRALEKLYPTRGKPYARQVRRLIAWRAAYPKKKLPNTCVQWSEKEFRIWAGREEESESSEEDQNVDVPSTMSNSLLTCPKCHKRQVDHFTKQTRSADEPETIFAHCLACNYRWRQ